MSFGIHITKIMSGEMLSGLVAVASDGKEDIGRADLTLDSVKEKALLTYTGDLTWASDTVEAVQEFLQDNLDDDVFPDWF